MTVTVRYKSTADFVTAEVQRLILSGDLASGERIDQVELARSLDVSRHPVRQAIERLAERGFIKINPHKGALVADMSADDLDELYSARIRLEIWCLRESWPNLIDKERKVDIRAIHATLDGSDSSRDLDGYMAANRAFHLAMYSPCGNRHLLRMVTTLFDLSERYQRTALHYEARSDQSRREHAAMMNAIDHKDFDTLVDLIEKHNAGTQRVVRKHLS